MRVMKRIIYVKNLNAMWKIKYLIYRRSGMKFKILIFKSKYPKSFAALGFQFYFECNYYYYETL